MASTTNNNNNNGNNEPTDDAAWRANVRQSYRNAEVRQIAKVLASLEPGASEASKLRLAMQFEDSIFKLGTSLADYHKRLTKRLKKLQKNYVPKVDANASSREKERVIQELVAKYGDDLKYIVKNAAAAIKEMREKYGEDKASQLKQHTDSVQLWATDLGLMDNNNSKPNLSMSDQQLEKLKGHLEKRLQNVRSHTVKLVHPDVFLKESLQKIQDDFKDKGRAVRIQVENMRKRYEQFQHGHAALTSAEAVASDAIVDPDKLLQQSLEQAFRPVPILARSGAATTTATPSNASTAAVVATTQPRAGNNNNNTAATTTTTTTTTKQSELDARVRAALLHLDKMRAASSVLVAYLCAPDKYSVPATALAKAHSVVTTGATVVQDVMREHRQFQQSSKQAATVHLQDAWLKPIVVLTKAAVVDLDNDITSTAGNTTSPLAKRPKLSNSRSTANRPVLRTRVLLTAGRKTSSNLVAALRSKGVTLVRPPPSGAGSYVQLQFEQAFCMTIYVCPLLVTLRAHRATTANSSSTTLDADEIDHNESSSSSSQEQQQQWKCGSWTPLHYGLPEREELTVGGAVKGTYETVGLAVEERLRDASAHATQALRTCFANNTATANKNIGDFEVELLEASALLEFVQLARDTYTPNWKDSTLPCS